MNATDPDVLKFLGFAYRNFHWIGFYDETGYNFEQHVLDEQSIRTPVKQTVCGKIVPDPFKTRVSLGWRYRYWTNREKVKINFLKGSCKECTALVEKMYEYWVKHGKRMSMAKILWQIVG